MPMMGIGEKKSSVRNRKEARNIPIEKIKIQSRIPKAFGILPS
jgi:hypothetical protein